MRFLTPGGKGQVGGTRSRDVTSNYHLTGEALTRITDVPKRVWLINIPHYLMVC